MNLVSIIVPIYKVEAYLRECVDSILAQTYRDIEVILVDDGSPDACPAICDEYAARDSRVRAIHKENGGVSSARNAGLDVARGDLIGFVDSDDWIAEDMIDILVRDMFSSEADISICGMLDVFLDGTISQGRSPQKSLYVTDEAIRLILKDELTSYVWNKLYRKHVFSDIRFVDGQLFEDVLIMHKLFEKARKISVVHEDKYYYRHREHSITASTFLNVDLAIQDYDAWRQRFLYAEKIYPDLLPFLTEALWFRIKRIYRTAARLRARGEAVDLARARSNFEDFQNLALYSNGNFCWENFRQIGWNKYILFRMLPGLYFSLAKWHYVLFRK
ncbi:glycosyltransferase [Synergistaceae bacterium OttesenSCG-928-I11]|nr:glycosyltransferase [Synergistaceae bacterium OttesenSCG-928-I11]